MNLIPLSRGKYAKVGSCDYRRLSKYHWYVNRQVRPGRINFYAARNLTKEESPDKHRTLYMHHAILGKPPSGFVVDHIDGDGLNNQKSNLRIVPIRQNQQNRFTPRTSLYPGVYHRKSSGKYEVSIKKNRKRYHVGVFISELDAYEAYKRAEAILEGGGNNLDIR